MQIFVFSSSWQRDHYTTHALYFKTLCEVFLLSYDTGLALLKLNKTNQLFYVSFDVSVTLAFKVLQNIHDIVDSFISFISNNPLRFSRSTDTVLGTYTSFNIINFQAFQD